MVSLANAASWCWGGPMENGTNLGLSSSRSRRLVQSGWRLRACLEPPELDVLCIFKAFDALNDSGSQLRTSAVELQVQTWASDRAGPSLNCKQLGPILVGDQDGVGAARLDL